MTYFRAWGTIMGPVCLTAVFGMGTGVSTRVCSPGSPFGYPRVAVRVVPADLLPSGGRGTRPRHRGGCVPGGEVNAVKQSAVSTGQLSALLHLHTPPIDLVIFQEPSQLIAAGGLISRRVSRLYAFSVYPGRT